MSVGATSNGQVFIQFQAVAMTGLGLFAGAGVAAGPGWGNQPLPNGWSTSTTWHSEVNGGWGAAVGASLDVGQGSVSGAFSPDPRIGAGYGVMVGTGVATTTTFATTPPIELGDIEAAGASQYEHEFGLTCH
jgi:hypothetical protein